MSGDGLRPGEIQLDDDAPPPGGGAPPPTDPPAGDDPPVTDPPADDPPPGDDPPAGDPPPPERKHTGAVAELIQSRKTIKQLTERLQAIESNPVIQRLTPEIQQAIAEGRLHIAPPQGSREAEQERLTGVAERLGLAKADGTPDLDAAKRVSEFVRDEVRAGVEPVRQGTLAEKARSNYDLAIRAAADQGYDLDAFKEVFDEVATQANGAELLSQKKVCEAMWERAVGKSAMRGKPGTGKKAAAPGARTDPPAAVITEQRGARPGATTTQLSPGLQRVYRDNGVDPSKSFTSTNKVDLSGPIDLE